MVWFVSGTSDHGRDRSTDQDARASHHRDGLPRGVEIILPPPKLNDANNVRAPGWIASRTDNGYVLRWIGGALVGREMGAPITEADFEHLRGHPEDVDAIIIRLNNEGLARPVD
ncbi:MAG: hypothetical protein L0G99_02540 [Propionibacteriales bacterium]|nr:hypothetical protein [Propionibacteriales bacterium]